MESLEKVFSFNIRKLRGQLTQAEMAERLDMSIRTYQHIEQGAIPQASTRAHIALKLGIPETALFLDPDISSPTAEQVVDVLFAALHNETFRKSLASSLRAYMPEIRSKK